ncbi:hypothetical protein N2152v2_003985 [Parachlorella kessleri]
MSAILAPILLACLCEEKFVVGSPPPDTLTLSKSTAAGLAMVTSQQVALLLKGLPPPVEQQVAEVACRAYLERLGPVLTRSWARSWWRMQGLIHTPAGDKAALAKAEDRFLEAALAQLQAELEPFARETTEDISMVLREAGLLQARHRKVRSTQFEGELRREAEEPGALGSASAAAASDGPPALQGYLDAILRGRPSAPSAEPVPASRTPIFRTSAASPVVHDCEGVQQAQRPPPYWALGGGAPASEALGSGGLTRSQEVPAPEEAPAVQEMPAPEEAPAVVVSPSLPPVFASRVPQAEVPARTPIFSSAGAKPANASGQPGGRQGETLPERVGNATEAVTQAVVDAGLAVENAALDVAGGAVQAVRGAENVVRDIASVFGGRRRLLS